MGSASEFFLVDGDSLLLTLTDHCLLNWSGSCAHFLQLTFLIEKQLQILLDYGLHFRIVFFEVNKLCFTHSFGHGACSPQSLLLYRASLIQHLISSCPGLKIERFTHWYSKEWRTMIGFHRPSFLLFDGGSLTCRSLVCLGLNALANGIGLASIAAIQVTPRSILTSCVEPLKNPDVIFMNEKLRTLDSEFYGDFASMIENTEENEAILRLKESLPDFFFPPSHFRDSIQLINEICSGSVDSTIRAACQWRSILAAVGFRLLLLSGASAEDQDFSKLFLLHIVMMDHCHLLSRPRAQSLEKDAENPFNKHLDRFCGILHLLVDHIAHHSSYLTVFKWDLVDLIDARYMIAIAHYIQQIFAANSSPDFVLTAELLGLDSAITNQLNSLWSDIVLRPKLETAKEGKEGLDSEQFPPSLSSFFPISRPFWNIENYGNFGDLMDAEEVIKQDIPIWPVRSPLSDNIIPSWRPIIHDGHLGKFQKLVGLQKRFLDDYHWHSGRRLDSGPQLLDFNDEKSSRGPRELEKVTRAWWQQYESLKARPNQSMSLQPIVMMASTIPTNQNDSSSLSSLPSSSSSSSSSSSKSNQKGKKSAASNSNKTSTTWTSRSEVPNATEMPKNVDADLWAQLQREKSDRKVQEEGRREKVQVDSLVAMWSKHEHQLRVAKLAAVSCNTASGRYHYLVQVLRIHLAWLSTLQRGMDFGSAQTASSNSLSTPSSTATPSPSSVEEHERLIKHQHTEELLSQCKSMIVHCCLRLANYRPIAPYFDCEVLINQCLGQLKLENLIAEQRNIKKSSSAFEQEETTVYSSTRFQLEHMGPWMARDVGAVNDPRVKGKLMDSWQVEVLNSIDSRQSCLVVAPTSAGKSFMASHAMRRTLETPDGILVYIAPTKALVQQTLAEVYGEFRDEFATKLAPGTFLVGVFTRDYRVNPTECRILITVPQCLEILLLSRELELSPNPWRKRLSWIVFDEIHSIESDEGAVWERILPLAPCPFIALSATIGQAHIFQQWLNRLATQKASFRPSPVVAASTAQQQDVTPKKLSGAEKWALQKQKQLAKTGSSVIPPSPPAQEAATPPSNLPPFRFIQHGYRYSDLYTYVALPYHWKTGPEDSPVWTTELRPMHPWTGLHSALFRSDAIPSTNLTSRECLQLYLAMAKRISPSAPNSPSFSLASPSMETSNDAVILQADIDALLKLKPEIYFKEGSIIDQKQCRAFESDLKAVFSQWCRHMPAVCDEILVQLSGTVLADLDRINERWDHDLGQLLRRSVVSLISGLYAQGWLPALVFNFERRFCEKMAEILVEHFENEDAAWKNSEKAKLALAKYERDLKAYQSRQQKKQKKLDKSRSKMSDNREPRNEDEDAEEEPIHPYFHRDQSGLAYNKDLDLEDLEVRFPNAVLINALKRGIGVHHAGLDKKYRQTVERLFRSGHLKVVFATGSLAMGMNMPCKTVVFAGDSPYLTPLMYRQMSGRSGRRGYDPLGRVVFWGIPSHRIRFLQGSRLSPIQGHFSVNVTWILRALSLASLNTKRINAHVDDKRIANHKKQMPPRNTWDDNTDTHEIDEVLGSEENVTVVDESTLPIPPATALDFESMTQVFKDSLFVHQREDRLELVERHAQCSLQLLVSMGLIDLQGTPQGLAGIATHLHFEEPANLALCRFLASPHILRLCSHSDFRGIVILLAHMFGRKPMPRYRVKEFEKLRETLRRSETPCDLVLPELEGSMNELVKEHDKTCFDILNSVIHSHSQTRLQGTTSGSKESWLPLSTLSLPEGRDSTSKIPSEAAPDSESVPLPLHLHLANTSLEVQSRSPCIAIGGFDDRVTCNADLSTLRSGLNALPFGTLRTEDFLGQQLRLNAYALDFFNHGNKEWLTHYNGLRRDDLFYLLGDFVLLLQTICASLTHLSSNPSSDIVLGTFTFIRDQFQEKYYTAFMPYRRYQQLPSILIQSRESLKINLQTHIQSKIHVSTRCKRVYLDEGFKYQITCYSDSDLQKLRQLSADWMLSGWKILPGTQ